MARSSVQCLLSHLLDRRLQICALVFSKLLKLLILRISILGSCELILNHCADYGVKGVAD